MIALRRLKHSPFQYLWGSASSHRSRGLHVSKQRSSSKRNDPRSQPRKVSLLEELFPEEDTSSGSTSEAKDKDLPRLPLPEVDEFFEDFQDDLNRSKNTSNNVTKTAAANAFRHQQLAVLALQIASKSLVESDFRRVAPRGKHIDEWTGPGDILKGELDDLNLAK